MSGRARTIRRRPAQRTCAALLITVVAGRAAHGMQQLPSGELCVALGRRRPQALRTHANTFSNDLLHALRAYRARQRRTQPKAGAENAIEALAQPDVPLHWLPSDLLAHICGFLLCADAAPPNTRAGAVPLTLRVRAARAAAEAFVRLQRSSKWADASLRALPNDGYDATRFEAMARMHTLRGGIAQLAREVRSCAHARTLRYALTQELLHCAGRDDCSHYCSQWRRDLNAFAAKAGPTGSAADPWAQLTVSVRDNLNAEALTSDAIVQLGLSTAPSGRKLAVDQIPWMARAAKEGIALVAVPSEADWAFLYGTEANGGPWHPARNVRDRRPSRTVDGVGQRARHDGAEAHLARRRARGRAGRARFARRRPAVHGAQHDRRRGRNGGRAAVLAPRTAGGVLPRGPRGRCRRRLPGRSPRSPRLSAAVQSAGADAHGVVPRRRLPRPAPPALRGAAFVFARAAARLGRAHGRLRTAQGARPADAPLRYDPQ